MFLYAGQHQACWLRSQHTLEPPRSDTCVGHLGRHPGLGTTAWTETRLSTGYLRVFHMVRRWEACLDRAPVSCQAAADCTCQVPLAVQVTWGESQAGVRVQDGCAVNGQVGT